MVVVSFILNSKTTQVKTIYSGEYAGFDENQPTSRSQGKPKVCGMLKSKHGYKKLEFFNFEISKYT